MAAATSPCLPRHRSPRSGAGCRSTGAAGWRSWSAGWPGAGSIPPAPRRRLSRRARSVPMAPPTLPEKIGGRHRDRLAVVYVRQSTLQQVGRHPESTRLQYALAERAGQLGWARGRVVVIDDDLGRSGASAEVRPGFQRLVAEVGLGRVGLVLGVEMSRLARSCRDWHQLLEICALFDTLIADSDGVYDPTSRYPYRADECSARAGNGHRSGASAPRAGVRARLAGERTRPGQLRPGCLPRGDIVLEIPVEATSLRPAAASMPASKLTLHAIRELVRLAVRGGPADPGAPDQAGPRADLAPRPSPPPAGR